MDLGQHEQQIINDYQNGKPGTLLAKEYEVSPHLIYSLLRGAGVAIRNRGGKRIYGNGWSQEFIKLYKSGLGIKEVANKLGVGFGTVQRAIDGISRPHGTRPQTIQITEDQTKLAYMAGMLDGEGTVEFRKKRRVDGNDSLGCKLAIYSTYKPVIQWMEDNIGGNVRSQDRSKDGWKTLWIWELYRAADIYAFLKSVVRFLIIKRDGAETMIATLQKGYGFD